MFLRVGNTVINTDAIASVHLYEDKVQVAFNYAGTAEDAACLIFREDEAEALRDYFTDPDNVVDLTWQQRQKRARAITEVASSPF